MLHNSGRLPVSLYLSSTSTWNIMCLCWWSTLSVAMVYTVWTMGMRSSKNGQGHYISLLHTGSIFWQLWRMNWWCCNVSCLMMAAQALVSPFPHWPHPLTLLNQQSLLNTSEQMQRSIKHCKPVTTTSSSHLSWHIPMLSHCKNATQFFWGEPTVI